MNASSECATHSTSSRGTTETKKPRPAGAAGRGLLVRLAAAAVRTRMPGACLLHHLNDAARARFDQHGLAVHHGVAIGRGTVGLRHVVHGDAGFRQHGAYDYAIRNGVSRYAFAHNVFAECRALIDGDTVDVLVDDDAAAADD